MIGVGTFRPCPAHLGGNPTGLACTCEAGHQGGHQFESSTGSWLEAAS